MEPGGLKKATARAQKALWVGEEPAGAGPPGHLEKEGCRASSGATVFPSALTLEPQHCPGTDGNPSPGLAVRLEPRGCVGTAGQSRNSVSACSIKFDTWKIQCC